MAETVAAAVAAASAVDHDQHSSMEREEHFNATTALVSFLRMEADIAEEKGRRLRQQATSLAQQFGVSEALQESYELDPGQMPPLDEHGIPKYKGKKRGRKPKPRKRKANPNRRKRQHTGYTLFMQETYPGIKADHSNLPSKDIIAILAKQWGDVGPIEKAEWKAKAQATHDDTGDSAMDGVDEDEAAAAAAAAAVEEEDDEEDDDDEEEEEDVVEEDMEDHNHEDHLVKEEEPAPPARRSRRSKK